MTDSFATPSQMEARSQGAIPADRPFLEDALKAATQRIRNFCGWHIADVQQDTFDITGIIGRYIFLPTMRIVSLDELVIDGVQIDLEPTVPLWEWSKDGLTGPWFYPRFRTGSAKITHGFVEVPADLVDMTLQVAARSMSSPLGAVREQTLSSSVTWSQSGFNQAGGTSLLDSEKDGLQAYKLGYVP